MPDSTAATLNMDARPLSLYATCQPSGGLGGADARGTGATNIKRRRTTAKSKLANRPPEAKRTPKVHAGRADRADLTGTRNPRKATNPGNRKTIVKSRATIKATAAPQPRRNRPLKHAIY